MIRNPIDHLKSAYYYRRWGFNAVENYEPKSNRFFGDRNMVKTYDKRADTSVVGASVSLNFN
jgi:hypothetical protein